MATDLHPVQPVSAAKKHEAFVSAQLARARLRIRSLDLAAAGLGLLILTLVYGLVLALCDRWLELSALVRQIAFALYAVGGCVYLGLYVIRPLFRPINPYYTARRLEDTVPHAKNSIVNWLDLHQQAIAPAFRNAIGQQAARDLADADVEQAISARRTSWMGAAAAGLFVCLLILFVLGPRQFMSLMSRAFAPFVEAPIATRTRILIEQPEGGDVTIPIGQAVRFVAWVEGRIPENSSPEALRLLYRYNPSDPYQTRLLEQGESTRQWFANLLASEVHNGFWYKMAGGDAETAEYHVGVRSTPLLTGFDVTYHYRPYLGWPDRITHDQNLQDLRGTEITLLARTNRTVKDGLLGIEGQKETMAGELVADDPQALRFHLRLDKDGNYRIWFRSVENERNTDPMAYTIRVLQDHPPQVELTKPGEDTELPANGVLHLEGSANDDFGIASLNLRMKLENGTVLQPKPYRKGEALRRGDGSFPQMLAYHDFVELDKLQRDDGKPIESLPVGAKLEYWLEAVDNCDYPGPNTGASKHFTVTIRAADPNQKKQAQDRQEARQEQQKHEKKQDQDLQKQKREGSDRPQEQNPPPEANPQNQEGGQQNEDELNKQKEKIENAIKKNEQQQKSGEKGENGGQTQESNGQGKSDNASEKPMNQGQGNGKEGGEPKPQANQNKNSGKPDANTQKQEQKGDGQAGSRSEANSEKQGGQQNKERRTDPGMNEGNQQRKETAPNQPNGANSTGQDAQPRPKPNTDAQPQDRTTPPSGTGEKSTEPKRNEGTAGQNAEKKEQNPNPGQGERKNEQQPAQPNTGQQTAGEKSGADRKPSSKPDAGSQPNTGNKSDSGAEKPEKPEKKGAAQEGAKPEKAPPKSEERQGAKAGSEQEKNREPQGKDGQASGDQKRDGQSEKAEKKGSSQSGSKQEAGQSKGEEKQGTGSENAPQQNPKQPSGNPPAGEKQERGTSGQQPEKGPQQGAPEKRGSQDESNADNRRPTKSQQQEKNQNPTAKGTQGANEAEKKDPTGSGSGQTDQRQPSKPDGSGAAQAREKAKEEITRLSEALKSSEEKTRSDARKRLEKLRKQAQDPAARQAAADALEKSDRESTGKPEQKDSGSKPAASTERSETQAGGKDGETRPRPEKGEQGNQNPAIQKGENGTGQSDSTKGERKSRDRTDTQGKSEPAPGERHDQAPPSQKPGGSGGSSGRSGQEPAAENPKSDSSRDDRPNREQDPPQPPASPNAAFEKRAGEMQLDDIKKRINKDVLNQLNMTQEDFDKFAKAYAEMLKRKQPSAPDKETLATPQRGNRTSPNQNLRRVDPREQSKDGKMQRLGPGAAPLEFRDAYREFSRKISELEQPKDKK
ncbi:MAG TPA: DUF4175 family protein [Gemmataceae bacterium]|nr:DUF4175 family protein [Gemmataceae bacterium]